MAVRRFQFSAEPKARVRYSPANMRRRRTHKLSPEVGTCLIYDCSLLPLLLGLAFAFGVAKLCIRTVQAHVDGIIELTVLFEQVCNECAESIRKPLVPAQRGNDIGIDENLTYP
jgi:hypothetical protein